MHTSSQAGHARPAASLAMAQISRLDRVPLKESETTIHLFIYPFTTLTGAPAR